MATVIVQRACCHLSSMHMGDGHGHTGSGDRGSESFKAVSNENDHVRALTQKRSGHHLHGQAACNRKPQPRVVLYKAWQPLDRLKTIFRNFPFCVSERP
jgi:hypothetical protein